MENGSKTLTIMFTDIKGFTERTSNQSRSATVDLIIQHKELLIPIFKKRGGTVVKTIGDAFLVVFESPTNAVLTGVEIQNALDEHNSDTNAEERLEVRVAINTGEVSIIDNDVFGEPVNVAARLESISEANDIYFTEATYLSMNRSEVPTAEIGQVNFKGIADKVKIFKVLRERPLGSAQIEKPFIMTVGAPKKASEITPPQKQAESNAVPPSPPPKPSGAREIPQPPPIPGKPGSPEVPPPPAAGSEIRGHESRRDRQRSGFSKSVFLIVMFAFMGLGMLFDMKQTGTVLGVGAAFGALGIVKMKEGEAFGKYLFACCVICFTAVFRNFDMNRAGALFGAGAGFLFMALDWRRCGRGGGMMIMAGLMLGGGFGSLMGKAPAGFMLGLAAGFALKYYFDSRKC